MNNLEEKYFKEVFKGVNIIQDDFEYGKAIQSVAITTDVATKFAEWLGENYTPFTGYSVMWKKDGDEYYFGTLELYETFINDHYENDIRFQK